jgi:transposase
MDTLVAAGDTESPMNKTEPTIASPTLPVPVKAQSKRYPADFKQAAVENWLRSRQPGTQIAAELGISYPSLKEWRANYSGTAMPEHGDLAAENRTLRAELARVREQRDILKKTVGIFTEPSANATKPLKA